MEVIKVLFMGVQVCLSQGLKSNIFRVFYYFEIPFYFPFFEVALFTAVAVVTYELSGKLVFLGRNFHCTVIFIYPLPRPIVAS